MNKKNFRQHFKDKFVALIITAFSLIAGLAWNDAVKTLIEKIFPSNVSSLWAKFGYAFLLTILLVVISFNFSKLFGDDDDEKSK